MAERLVGAERRAALEALQGWREVEGRDAITRSFRFRDFSEAWAFMSRVALLAEKLDHHPEWTNVWNRVDVVLSTHSLDGLSTLDLALAMEMDRLAAGR